MLRFLSRILGILDGMITSLSNDINRVVIHIDNLKVVQVLQDNLLRDSSITIHRKIQKIMNMEGHSMIRYVPKVNNRVADCLTKLSSEGMTGL